MAFKYAAGSGQSINGALDSEGNFFPLDSLQQTINKDANGSVTSVVATDGVNTWTQTYTYTDVKTVISQWAKA